MRYRDLLRESMISAWTQRTPSAMVAIIVAALCVTVLSTVGRTAATEQRIQQRVEAAGSRVLEITDTADQALLAAPVVAQVQRLNTTERVVGLTAPRDMSNGLIGPGGTKVPVWGVTGRIPDMVRLVDGRWPRPGEALVSTTALARVGMDAPFGVLQDDLRELAVVGSYAPRPPFELYDGGAITPTTQGTDDARTLHVVVRNSADAPATERAVIDIVDPPQPDAIQVQSPTTLAQLQTEVGADLGRAGQSLLYGTLGAGATLTTAVVFADVLVRRKDLGRRRALGATRSTVLALVVLRTIWPAIAGSTLGTIAGLVWTQTQDAVPPLTFAVGVAVLGVLSACVAAIGPAAAAAGQDPVRVLRTP